MSEDKAGEEALKEEVELVRTFLVRCKVKNVVSGETDVFLDTVDASSEDDAKDVVAGRLADHDLDVTDWEFIRDAGRLRDLVRIVSR